MTEINTEIYRKCGLNISDFIIEPESEDYNACKFQVNGKQLISRTAKITPKKVGQFVTFWNRNKKGTTQPYFEKDNFHFYVINVKKENRMGQFVFPKAVLIAKGIVSTEKKDGKRGFRVYPVWDAVTNKQALKTQQWQLDYFFEIDSATDFKKVAELYH